MGAESTQDKIRAVENLVFGGRVERMNGQMCFLDGMPAVIPEENNNPAAHTEKNVQTVKGLEALFQCLFPSIVFPEFSVMDLFNEVTQRK